MNNYNIVKSVNGAISNIIGHESEDCVKIILENNGYTVIQPANINNPGYDLVAYKLAKKYIIQVKTDVNNNGKYPQMSKKSIKIIKTQAKKLDLVPILIKFNYKKIK